MDFTLENFSGMVESALQQLSYPTVAPALFAPVSYTLSGGGKRIRPCLTLATFAALTRRNPEEAINQALAVEMFHNFTLLHDDVMDKAELRRGRPTVHCRWNDNVAILSGDAMLTYASQLLARDSNGKLEKLLNMFNTTAMEVYEGQQLDMEFETRKNVTIAEYMQMIQLKTSVLIGCACALGAIKADASEEVSAAMYQYGFQLGVAFQLRDDWLDTFGDPAIFGKEIGGDIVNNKKTWLLIKALQEEGDELSDILNEDLEEQEKINQVVRIYNRLNLGEQCEALARSFSDTAIKALDGVAMDADAKAFFTDLAIKASTRSH